MMRILKRTAVILFLFGLVFLLTATGAGATGSYFEQIPAGVEQSCNLCHSQIPALNDKGTAFMTNNYDFGIFLNSSEGAATGQKSPSVSRGGTGLDRPDSLGAGGTADAGEPIIAEEGASGESSSPIAGTVADEAASADSPYMELILPAKAARGEKIRLQALVQLGDTPQPGQEVVFYEETDFFGWGKMEIDKAVTNGDGIATTYYRPSTTEHNIRLMARIEGADETILAQGEGIMPLAVGGPLTKPFEGLAIPFIGPWLLGVVVGALWGVYFYAGSRVLGMSRGRRREAALEREFAAEKKQVSQAHV